MISAWRDAGGVVSTSRRLGFFAVHQSRDGRLARHRCRHRRGLSSQRLRRRNGFVVVANSRDIEAAADECVVAVPGNIGDRSVAEQVVRTAIDRLGRIDTLIINAGIFIGRPFNEYTVEDLHNIFKVNIAGFFNITQLAIAQMIEQRSGHVVQVTATLVSPRELAIEYASQNIRVNAVAPGVIKTPMHKPATYDVLEPVR